MQYPTYTYQGERFTLAFEASNSCTGPILMTGQVVLRTASGKVAATGNAYNETTTYASSYGIGTNLAPGNYEAVYTRSNYSSNGWTNSNPYCTVNGNYLNCTRSYALTLKLPVQSPKESRGSSNPGSTIRHACTGDPIDCATGNLTETQRDLSIGGRGPGLHVERSYNALTAAEAKEAGPFGYGWSGTYSAHLEINAETETVTVVQDNGSSVIFIKSATSGAYEAATWIQATLKKEGSNYLYTLPDQTKLEFNTEGRLAKEVDRNGNAITLAYEAGKLKAAKDAAGRELTFAYTGSQVTSVKDPMGHEVTYAYEAGNLISVTLPGEASPRWKFKYDGSHQLTEVTDGRGSVLSNEYDASHRVKKQTDPAERVTKLEYGETEGHMTTTITEPNGSTTFEQFNSAGEPIEVIRAKGTAIEQKRTKEYSGAYELVKATDALGHSTTFEYSAAGDLTLDKDAEGNETRWTYNAIHDVETEMTPKGEKTTYKRDAHGNVETIERPAPGAATQKWSFKHAANGDLESETDPLGHETKFEYDAYGDLKGETDPAGDKTSWTYNKDGQELTKVSPRGNAESAKAAEFETVTERDAQGRPVKVTDPLGHESKYAYDKDGNLESKTDPLGHTTHYIYDADNEQTKVENANGTTTETAYDSMGEVKSRTDGNGHTTKFDHNALEQLTETIDPLERRTIREYDAAGRLEKLKDAEGRTTTLSYDKANRLTKKGYSEVATHTVEYAYDKDGNITKMVDGTGTTETIYDVLDRLTEFKNGNSEVIKYEYNLGNLQTKITYPNGKAVSREFDKAGRLASLTDWLGKKTSFAYNPDSDQTATTFPAGTGNVDEYGYDRTDAMTSVAIKKGSEALATVGYLRDKAGQLESLTSKGLPGAESEAFSYDPNNRLTKAGSASYEYDAANNLMSTPGSANTYDKAGQLEKGTNVTYTYDEEGERTKAVKPSELTKPSYKSSFGSSGTGNGQFKVLTDVTIDPTNGTLWVADDDNDRVQHFNSSGEYLAQFKSCSDPGSVAVNSAGAVYVACSSAQKIEKYNAKGEALKTIATYGSGEGQIHFPLDLSFDSGGSLWVADTENDRIDEFSSEDKFVKSISLGSGSRPWGVSVSPNTGDIWVAEPSSHRISVFSQKGEALHHYGSQGTGNGQFAHPSDVEVADGYVWVADAVNDRVEIFNEAGEFIETFGSKGTGEDQLNTEWWLRVAVSPSGDIWVSDDANHRVQRWRSGSFDTSYKSSFGSSGTGNGQFKVLTDVTIDPTNGTLWVADDDNDRVQHFNSSGEYLAQFKSCSDPGSVAVNSAGAVYVACSSAQKIEKYNAKGEALKTIATYGSGEGQIHFPLDLSFDSGGSLWVADTENDRIDEFSSEDKFVKSISLGSGSRPWGVSVSPNTGDIWVAEPSSHRISVFSQKGEALHHYGSQGTGNGQFAHPSDVEVADGYVWVADAVNDRVEIFNEAGEFIETFGSKGTGEDQLNTEWWLRVAVSPSGDIWVSDDANHRVQRWGWESAIPRTIATTYTYDQAGNLTAVERPEDPETPTIKESYTYDGTGLRASQTVSGAKSYLTWDETGSLPLLLNDGFASYIYGPGGLPIEQISSETPTYYHHDQLGSTRILTNPSGNATGTFTYSSYGQPAGSTGTQATPLGYSGQYTNKQSGLQNLRARVYDPVTGQFLTRDPLEAFTGAPYTYGRDNPANFVDPSGRISIIGISIGADEVCGASWEIPVVDVATCGAAAVGTAAAGAIAVHNALAESGGEESSDGEQCPLGGTEIGEGQAGHIFRDAPGHFAEDTPGNRELLEDAVKPENHVETRPPGVDVYRETLPSGEQIWVEVYDGKITNGGVNETPR